MKKAMLAATIIVSLSNCEKNQLQPHPNQIVLHPKHTRTSIQSFKYNPELFGHQKSIYVPISYYQPIADNTPSQLRLLIPLVYDPDYGMVQPTTINITGCDSFELNGQELLLYSHTNSSVTSVTTIPGTNALAVYDTNTVVMIIYSDSTMNIIPNWRRNQSWLSVPQRSIDGLLFLATDKTHH